jgi:hypothetical protein
MCKHKIIWHIQELKSIRELIPFALGNVSFCMKPLMRQLKFLVFMILWDHLQTYLPIGTMCTAWDAPWQQTYILAFPQSLFFGNKLKNSLMPPNQLRANGLIVDECPKQFSNGQFSNGQSLHGIRVPDEDITIPFHMYGMISCINGNRLPTQEELDECQWIYMTSEKSWNPYNDEWTQHRVHAI